MTSREGLDSTRIYDGKQGRREVRVGDSVDLVRPVQEEGNLSYLAREGYFQLRGKFGKGPFEVLGMGQWPCGTVFLDLKVGNRTVSEKAKYFEYVETD